MTARDRILAALQGGNPDRKPVIGEDLLVVPLDRLAAARSGKPEIIILGLVHAPLTRSRFCGQDLSALLESDPASGNDALDGHVMAAQIQINDAIHAGADGICYLIDGAYPAASTPMQYGGFFLERDRALLESASRAHVNMVLVAGSEEPYIDFVSDLPAALFAWDARCGWSPDQVRELRTGACAADHPEADFKFPLPALQAVIQLQGAARP